MGHEAVLRKGDNLYGTHPKRPEGAGHEQLQLLREEDPKEASGEVQGPPVAAYAEEREGGSHQNQVPAALGRRPKQAEPGFPGLEGRVL